MKLAIYRVIGNSLPPRDTPTDRLNALEQIIQLHADASEGVLPDAHYIVNHIHDADFRDDVVALLDAYECQWTELTFEPSVFRSLEPEQHILYAININNARNEALRQGFANGYDWVAVFDQDCFITPEQWPLIQERMVSDQATNDRKYYSLLSRRRHSMAVDAAIGEPEEPMILFRKDAPIWFNPLSAFGKRDKLELCLKIGHKGWKKWGIRGQQTKVIGHLHHLSFGDQHADDSDVRKDLRTESLERLLTMLRKKWLN